MDDDGAPPRDREHEKPAPKIGIAPATTSDEPIILKDVRRERQRYRDQRHGGEVISGSTEEAKRPNLILTGVDTPILQQGEAPRIVDHRGEEVSSLTWQRYIAWRQSKCRPYDYANGPLLLSISADDAFAGEPRMNKARALEEVGWAILSLIGEVAELAELFQENGVKAFYSPVRENLIDEAGDILFSAAWAFDAWGHNPLVGLDDLELLRVTDEDLLAVCAQVIATQPPAAALGNGRFVGVLSDVVYRSLLPMQTNAGLLADSYRKLRYHRKQQDVDVQIGRIASVLGLLNQILVVANSSIEEAMLVNMKKIDAKYPGTGKPSLGLVGQPKKGE